MVSSGRLGRGEVLWVVGLGEEFGCVGEWLFFVFERIFLG